MNKYLVKPTKIIDERGFVYSADTLDETSGFNDLKKKIDELNTESILALQDRVYALETTNGYINDRIDTAETNANEAKNTANIAHNSVTSMITDFNVVAKDTETAKSTAIENKADILSLCADYENLKSRVEDLEDTGGQASEPIVGKSKIGYLSDFTGYVDGGSYYVVANWGSEARSLYFDTDTLLGDVLEEIMYCVSDGLSEHETRIKSLEDGSGTTSGSGNCLDQELTIKPYEDTGSLGEDMGLDLEEEMTATAKDWIDTSITNMWRIATNMQYLLGNVQTVVSEHDNKITSNTNTIQSLDTRTGSHTASIGSLENRMTDAETTINSNKSRISLLEAGSNSGENATTNLGFGLSVTVNLDDQTTTLNKGYNQSGATVSIHDYLYFLTYGVLSTLQYIVNGQATSISGTIYGSPKG